MASTFTLNILTPSGLIYEGESESVMAPALDGYIGVLAHHAAMIAALRHGYIMSRHGSDQKWFSVVGGVMEVVRSGEVQILADFAAPADNQDAAIARAKAEVAVLSADIDDSAVAARV